MVRSLMVLLVVALVTPLSAQTRRPQIKAFPLSVSVSGGMNAFGSRALVDDPIVPACDATNCRDLAFTRGMSVGAEVQLPLFSTFGLGVGADGMTMLRRDCIPGGNCNADGRVFGIRARAQILARIKARAPVYFGFGGAALQVRPATFAGQTQPTLDVGTVATIGADFAAGPRTFVRVTWNSYFLKTDRTDAPPSFLTGTAHDGVISVGARMLLGS